MPVFGVGEHDGLPYYVMQFIQGLGLDEVLEELKRQQSESDGSGRTRVSAAATSGSRPGPSPRPRARRDVTAADMARSLLTGRFATAADLEATVPSRPPMGTPVRAPGRIPQHASPAAGRLSDSFSLSSSSVMLPGTGSGPRGQEAADLLAERGPDRRPGRRRPASTPTRQGILHRDIKPSNLLLDTAGTVWVTDFGLAKADDQQNLTHTGDILGTLRYMPPEAFDGQADARGDVYSLGLTLYELLALRPAFDEKDRNQLIKQVTTEEPPRLDELNPEVPRDLETIVHKAIDRDPAQRYARPASWPPTCSGSSTTSRSRPGGTRTAERSRRWARRNPGVAGLGAALTALLVMATVASLFAAGHFNQLRLSEARAAASERLARHEAEVAAQEADTAARKAKAAAHEAEVAAQEARRRGDAERWERYRSNIAAASAALQLQNSGPARAPSTPRRRSTATGNGSTSTASSTVPARAARAGREGRVARPQPVGPADRRLLLRP